MKLDGAIFTSQCTVHYTQWYNQDKFGIKIDITKVTSTKSMDVLKLFYVDWNKFSSDYLYFQSKQSFNTFPKKVTKPKYVIILLWL